MIKAFAEDREGNPVLVVGITQAMVNKLVDGAGLGFDLAEIGHPNIFIQLRVSPDEETLVRDWATRGLIPPGTATQILEGIAHNRAERVSGKVWDVEG